MAGNGVINEIRERSRQAAAEAPAATPKPPRRRGFGPIQIAAFVLAVIAGSVFTALFMIPIQVPVVGPLEPSSDVPSFSQVQSYLRPAEGSDPSAYGLDMNDGSSLTAEERVACEEAGHKARSAEESATAPDPKVLMSPDPSGPGAGMLPYQLRPTEMLKVAQLRGQLSCYAATRPARLCAEAERAHLAKIAAAFAAEYASGAADVDAIDARKSRLAMLTGVEGAEGEKIIAGIVADYRSHLSVYRRQALAMLRSVAPWMPAESYAAALGGTVPESLAVLLADIGVVESQCRAAQP